MPGSRLSTTTKRTLTVRESIPMRRTTRWAGGVAVAALTLNGCGGAAKEAAQAAFEACGDREAPAPVVRLDGDVVYVEMKGENAQPVEQFGDLRGEAREDSALECLAEHTGYPGIPGHFADGEEWDGWRYHFEDGAGYEHANVFTATG